MQEKVNKSKAKRLAKEAAKQAKRMEGVKIIMPIQNSVVNMTPVLQPALSPNSESQSALDKMAIALTRLRIHAGDEQDMAIMFSRVMFGRRLAHFYFDDITAENLHHTVQTVVIAVLDQYVQGQNPQVMSLDDEAGKEVSEALHTIEEMAKQMDTAVYLKELLTHDQDVKNIDAEDHLQSWEDYLKNVGIRSIHTI